MNKKRVFAGLVFLFVLLYSVAPVRGQSNPPQYSCVLVYTAKFSDTIGLSEAEIVEITKEKGSIEEVYVKAGENPLDISQRYLIDTGQVGIGYPGFHCLSDKKFHEFKAKGLLKHKLGQEKVSVSIKRGRADIGMEWRFQKGTDIANDIRCSVNGNFFAKTNIKRRGKGKNPKWPSIVITEQVNKSGKLVQVFEYIEKKDSKRNLRVKGLSKKPHKNKYDINSLGDKKASKFDTLGSAATESVMTDLVKFSGNLTGLSYSYDSGWQPAGYPLQMRVAFGAGADISSSIEGELLLNTSTNRLSLGSAYSELAMDFGVEFSAEGSVDLWLWDPFIFDIPIPYFRNFDFRINNRSYYSSYLLDSYAVVSDTTETQTIVNIDIIDLILAGAIPIPGLGGGINVDCTLSGRSEMTGTGIWLTDSSYFTQEYQSQSVSISSNGYHETAYYYEDLTATCTLITYPAFFIDFAFWHWEIPTITLPWDLISGTIDLNLSSSSVDFSIAVPSSPSPVEPDAGETVYGTNVDFDWTQSSGASEYYLEIAFDSGFSSIAYSNNVGNTTGMNISSFPDDGTKFYWHVKAGNTSGWSHYSDTSYFYSGETLAEPNPPQLGEPTNGSFIEGSTILLKWKASERADNYYFQLSPNTAFSVILAEGAVGNTTELPISGFLNDGSSYYWRVKAGNTSGWSDYSATWSFTNGLQLPPSVPSLASPATGSNVSGSDIVFRWNPSMGAYNYHFQLSVSDTFNIGSILLDARSLGDTTEISISGFLDNGVRFYWRVRAQNSIGWSDYSAIWYFDNGNNPIPQCPQLISPSNGINIPGESIEFSWNPSANATNYWFEIATDVSFTNLLHSSNIGNYTSISATGFPDDGTEYYWRVSAGNENGFGDCQQYNSFVNGLSIQLRVSSPNGNELWKQGSNQLITWETGISGTIRIELYLNDVLELVIADFEVNDGSYSWSVPSNLPEHHLYKIRIISNDTPVIFDESDYYFTILGQPMELFDDFESGVFSQNIWHNVGSFPWTIVSDEYYDGSHSAHSGAISNNEISVLKLNKNVPTGKISFYRKVSSEFKYDWLTFHIDEKLMGIWSGEKDWSRKEYYVEEGPHSFVWAYLKDYSISEGSDSGWIDSVKFEEEPQACHLYAWTDFHGYEYRTHNMELMPDHFFTYNWYYEDSWLIYYDDGGFTATFDSPQSINMDLSVTHLSSAASNCPGNGYSPITIKINDVEIALNYDPAENHNGTHGYVTDKWEIPVVSGTNVVKFIANDLCTNYWIQSLEIREKKLLVSDINCNGAVNLYDFSILSNNWLTQCQPPNWCSGSDFTEDRQIDIEELLIMSQEWLQSIN